MSICPTFLLDMTIYLMTEWLHSFILTGKTHYILVYSFMIISLQEQQSYIDLLTDL